MAQEGSSRLEVHVVTPEQEVWTGEADFLIATAIDGEIGILPGHAPLLAALDVGRLAIDTGGGTREEAAVDGGFLHVKDDRVDVLAEHAEMGGDVDELKERRRERDEERSEEE
ncbi:MAG: F0F1 ATP synthase subunit epsilon [Actinomycetota bacterium]